MKNSLDYQKESIPYFINTQNLRSSPSDGASYENSTQPFPFRC